MPGNVTPRSDMQRKLGIIAGPCDELAKAAVRKAGAGILRDGMDDVGFAALDEYRGDDFADRPTKRDGVKMTLALGAGVDDKIGVAKCCRLAENRTRHGDGVIGGKGPNQRRRRIREGCDMAREPGPGFHLDHGNEGLEYLVKQLELLLRMTAGPGNKQIGDARERP